jgi:uncharacterized protein (TIGR00297 family)
VLAAFFVGSSLVSRVDSRTVPSALDAKGPRRDAWQVFANGGAAAITAAVPGIDLSAKLWLVTASLAAAAADTWATSIGTHSRVAPRLLWSRRPVAPGTSGGVTLAGCAGAAVGGTIVAAVGAMVTGNLLLLPTGILIGFLGMLVDSLLGGTVQGRFHCPRCDQASEWTVHRCGTGTQPIGGLAWLDNDAVNFLATTVAAGAAGFTWWLLERVP